MTLVAARTGYGTSWIAAALGAVMSITLFYPGFMSPDSADQWLQARTGVYTSTHPPLMAFIWSFIDRIVPGPGGLFVLHTALFWFALGWLGRELFVRPWSRVAFVLAIGLWPPVFGTVAHLWKDVPMTAFALLGMAALARGQNRRTPGWLFAGAAFFCLACAYRHNALPLTLPFLVWIIVRLGVNGTLKRMLAAGALVAAVAVLASLPARHSAVAKRDVWPVTAVWDLAAVSIAQDRMLIPADWRSPQLTLDELRTSFKPWSNTTVFDSGKLLISLYAETTSAQRRSLRDAWLQLWVKTPMEIAWHRLRLAALLLGFMPDQVPLGLKIWLQTVNLPENPPVTSAPSPFHDSLREGFYALADTPLFAGWIYLALLCLLALRARKRPQHGLFWPTIASVILYCAPLVLFAPSAEFRYLLWPVIAVMIVLALSVRRRQVALEFTSRRARIRAAAPGEQVMNRCISILLPGLMSIASAHASDIDAAALAGTIEQNVVNWRRDIHQHPELGNREVRTAKLVADHLRSLGLEPATGIAHTGVTAVLKGGLPGPKIALRADMDALPVTERTDVAFASKVTAEYRGESVGVMHACGHDAHTAILMGVAEALVGMKERLPGEVLLVFQPAEEGPPEGEDGGALMMLEEGIFDRFQPEAVFGLHVFSTLNVGKLGYRSGPMMAASDRFTIVVKGRQTHGSRPWGGIDPVVAAADIITSAQSIVSRQMDISKQPVVLSFGAIKGGIRYNIIPDDVELIGTIRTFDDGMRDEVFAKLKRTAEHVAAAHGATVEAAIPADRGNPVTSNDPALTERVLPSLRKVAGEANLVRMPLITGAEDFSEYARRVPGFFFFVGATPAGQDPRTAPSNHSPEFFLDEGALRIGTEAMLQIALDYLHEQ